MAIFAVGYGAAWLIGLPIAHAAVAGAVAAAPVIIAVIGERVTGIKAFGVELNLAEVSASIAGDSSRVAADLSEVMGQGRIVTSVVESSVVDSSSAGTGLSGPMQQLAGQGSKLLQIDLRNNKYWWPTRLFLVAALAQDYTQVEAVVFVREGTKRIYVGIATPRAVRTRLARAFPSCNYETAYRQARDSALHARNAAAAIEAIIGSWPGAIQKFGAEPTTRTVSSDDLQAWMQTELDTQSVPNGPLTPHQRYRIVSQPRRYIALTTDERLDQVVDRDEIVTAAQMERRFGNPTPLAEQPQGDS
jgi:hypothetical protein